jgi:hypothetical protein
MENTAPQQQTAPTPIEPPVPVQPTATSITKSSNKLLSIFLTVALVATAGIGGYVLGTQRPSQIVEKEQTATPLVVTSEKDLTANWKTISSTFWTFKVPANLNYVECNSHDQLLVGSPDKPSGLFDKDKTIECNFDQSGELLSIFRGLDNSQNTIIIPINTNHKLDPVVADVQIITVDGKKATFQKETTSIGQGTGTRYKVYIHQSNYTDVITFNDVNQKEVFEQILSTFKFNETKSTDNWLKYKNSFYGFTIEYPPTGEGPTGSTIACGQNITEDPGSLVLHTDFENYFGIFSVNGYQTVKKYLDEEKLSVSLTPITIRGADEAYKVSEPNGTSIQYLMRKGTKVIRIDKNNGVLEGCFQPKDWDITQNFYFE